MEFEYSDSLAQAGVLRRTIKNALGLLDEYGKDYADHDDVRYILNKIREELQHGLDYIEE